ncbi:hypothetical protein PUN28_008002 [Cardiocondyla obscurior]|uniref:Protein regulator of cytokinesis 1 n=1 Tax=Cardiocondyla obscurior TaxID=286306 RepID=A0AAW2G0K3_9HYME
MADELEVSPFAQKMFTDYKKRLVTIRNLLEDIGYTENVRSTYYTQAHGHVMSLMSEMVDEIQAKQQRLINNIKDMLKQTSALHAELHLDTLDIQSKKYENPLWEVEQLLQKDLENLKCMKEERMVILKELLAREYDICKKLGCKELSIAVNVLPTEQELDSFKLYLQKQESEKARLETIFIEIRASIIMMMNDLDISPTTPFEDLICNKPEEFVLNDSNMTKLKELKTKLEIQVEDTKCCLEKMKEDLLVLWKYLDEPNTISQAFFERHTGYGTNTINAFNAEIKRCKEKRKENICKYVKQVRHELINLWDLCKFSEEERNMFAPFFSNTFTDDLLTLHELEVERLRKFYNDNHMIFELLEQRDNILKKMKELLQRANNPDRYHNRGGQLLMEEKERKVIQKKLPKIEEELRQLNNEYKIKHNQSFTIYGTTLENVVMETWENIHHEKESIKKARKEAKDKSIKKSPLNSSKRTPGIATHLSVHRGPGLGVSKRKLFTPSPNSPQNPKRKNKTCEKIKPTITVTKVRRSGIHLKSQKLGKSPKSGKKKRDSFSTNNSITDTTYNQFQGHMTNREELHSSMLPEQILKVSTKSNIMKTPVRTPMKPLRKHLLATTPLSSGSTRKIPHSPRVINTPKLATAPSNLPFIF